MKYQAAALALLLNTSTVLAGVQRRDGSDRRWGQCAGQNYDGPTDCPSGWTCQLQNQYYSQCLQGGSSGGGASGSGSGSGSVSSGSSNGTGSLFSGSTGSAPIGSGSKLGLSSPVSSPSSSLPSGGASSGTSGTAGNDDNEDDEDDSEGTCDTEDEEDTTNTTTTKSSPVVAPAGKLAAGVTTNGGAAGKLAAGSNSGSGGGGAPASGGSTTSSASGAGPSGGSTTPDTKSSDTGSGTTGSDSTSSSGATNSGNNTTTAAGGGSGGGKALATTTQYGPLSGTSPGACGCAGSWQNGDNATTIVTAAGGPSILNAYCGSGCGACYLLTSTGTPPCSTDGCKVSGASAGETLTIMVTNSCPAQGNQQWCTVPNQYGYGAHFDLAMEREGWGNVVVQYEPVACPGAFLGEWAGCKCAGRSQPHEGAVPVGGKTSVE